MNTNTNELISNELFKKLTEEEKKEFTPVPPGLITAAKKKLGKKERTFVAFKSGGKLSEWAKYQRSIRKKGNVR